MQPAGKLTLIKEIADSLDIPVHFLAKILQNLSKSGILVSHKGPNGGFALAKPASEISLMQVVTAIDGWDFVTKCVVGFPECSDDNPCPLHHYWGKIRTEIQKMLMNESIAEIAKETVGGGRMIRVLSKK